MSNRIGYLDGLRGIAILNVVLFHAYSRWGAVETFKQSEFFSELFSYGWLGVNLFFCISGYVIYMSLIRSENFFMFAIARFLRLAPAMFLASMLIFFSSFYILERPLGPANIVDLLPGITFLGPGIISDILNIDVKSLDGAFWSLYVEVRFYIISAILYFFFRDRNLYGLFLMFIFYFFTVLLFKLNIVNVFFLSVQQYLIYFSTQHYGWFLIGIFLYKYVNSSEIKNLFIIIVLSSMIILIDFFNEVISFGSFIGSIITIMIFIIPVFFNRIKLFLSSKILLFFGLISYPLYLIHQNLVTGLAIKVHNMGLNFPSFMLPIPFLFLVIFISSLIVKLEAVIRRKVINFIPSRIDKFKQVKK
jgi:peptidoglycan/LPS O-acetylase OafA/YrhL